MKELRQSDRLVPPELVGEVGSVAVVQSHSSSLACIESFLDLCLLPCKGSGKKKR